MNPIELNKEKCKDLTKKLAEQIEALHYEDLPEEVLERGRQVFIDGIAVGIAGFKVEAPPAILAENAKEMGGAEQATVLGQGFKTSVTQAAMINGGAIHVLDFEPMWNPPNHLMSPILPAVLGLAEYQKSSGREILTGLVKGVEMAVDIRNASGMHDLNEARFHLPSSVGPLGAVVGAGHMLGLNVDQIRNSIGIVSSRCGGVWINVGTHTKCLHCGNAAQAGLDSALLAKRGYTANPNALEGPRGFIESFMNWEKFDADILLDYGKKFRILNPGYEVKMYPSNYGTHAGINAALALYPKIKNLSDIVSIEEDSVNQQYCNRPFPESGLSGKFSHQYTVVRALIDGKVDLGSFTDEKRFEPLVDELLGKYELRMHEDWPVSINGGHPTVVKITLKDGTVLEEAYPKPDFRFGAKTISKEFHHTKLKSCLMKGMSEAHAEQVIDMGYQIDKLNDKELEDFFRLVRC